MQFSFPFCFKYVALVPLPGKRRVESRDYRPDKSILTRSLEIKWWAPHRRPSAILRVLSIRVLLGLVERLGLWVS